MVLRPETHVIDCGAPDVLKDKYTDKDGNTITVLELKKVSEGVPITFLESPKWLKKCDLKDVRYRQREHRGEAARLGGV